MSHTQFFIDSKYKILVKGENLQSSREALLFDLVSDWIKPASITGFRLVEGVCEGSVL